MQNEFQWSKILAPEEEFKKEFSISPRFQKLVIIFTVIAAIAVCFYSIFAAVFILLLGGFYWFYLTKSKHYCFTNKRIVLVESFLGSNTVSIDYAQVTDIEVEQSVLDQFGNWGTIVINTAGTHAPQIRLSFIDNPNEIKIGLDQIRDQK